VLIGGASVAVVAAETGHGARRGVAVQAQAASTTPPAGAVCGSSDADLRNLGTVLGAALDAVHDMQADVAANDLAAASLAQRYVNSFLRAAQTSAAACGAVASR
jgi:hypothetical protein